METNPLISVITPFHNVEMDYFKACVDSVRRQSLGFANLEWIIVLHNCEPRYAPLLQEMFASDANVVLLELNDEFHTPSSPRNLGIDHARAPFLCFLDGDDRLTETCLETVLREMDDTYADMVQVRREAVPAAEGLLPLKAKSKCNGTVRRSIVENGHWNQEMFATSSWGYSTSFFYRTRLLHDNYLRFDTGFVFAEDFYFVLQCIVKAKRLCYLHQFIGYVYLQNEQSIIQTSVKPAAMVMDIARNYRALLELMNNYGIDRTYFIPRHLTMLAGYVIKSPDLTYEQRLEIKSFFDEELRSFTPDYSPSKFFSQVIMRSSIETIYNVLLSPETTLEKIQAQIINGVGAMARIVTDNISTDFGRRNHFHNIRSIQSYRFRTPLTDQAFYQPLLDLQTRVGENELLTMEPVILYFQGKNGTLYPATLSHLKPYDQAVKDILNGHHNLWVAQSQPVIRTTADEADVDYLYSALVKRYFAQNYLSKGRQQAHFSAPVESFFLPEAGRLDYRSMALNALADADIDQIVGFRTTYLDDFFRYLEAHWTDLLPEVICSESRKTELKAIFEQGFDDPIAPRLWRKLQKVVAYGAGELYEHTHSLKRYTGQVPHNHGYFLTEETIFGKAVADESNLFECLRGNDFYELLPMMAESSQTLLWTETKANVPYSLVVTNHAGLYRFVTEHIICPKEVGQNHIYYTIY